MGNQYDDARYGVIQRTWFGLTPKLGGMTASGITMGTTGTTKAITTPTRWYPKGPINMVKAGFRVLATITSASSAGRPLNIFTRGASASVGCTVNPSTCSVAQYAVASTVTFTVAQVKAGEYCTFKWGTAKTFKSSLPTGTAKNATVSGTVAIFVDWVPTFSSKFDPGSQ